MQFFPVMVAGFAAAVGFTPVTKRLAIYLGVLDQPSSRKVHTSPTPLMGGLAIYSAFVISLLLFSPPFYLVEFGAIMTGATWLAVVGFLDDRNGMQPLIKMTAQLIAGIVLVAAGIHIRIFASDTVNVGLTLFWIVGVTNAMNFQDNMDGLAAGITAIASIFFFIMAVGEELTLVSSLAAALAGASVGFLIYNFNPASTFMGDMGSMVLGFILSVLAIKMDFKMPANQQIITGMVPIVVLGFPIFDTTLVVFTRLRERRSPMSGGKDHTSHRIASMGLSHKATVLLVYGICILLGLVATELAYASALDGLNLVFRLVLVAGGAFFFLEYVYLRTKHL